MDFFAYFNPYSRADFFEFFSILTKRIASFFHGDNLTLASDEIQILVLLAIAMQGALVGTFLLLRRMAMLANAISHTILVGIMATYLLLLVWGKRELALAGLPFSFSLVSALIAGLVTACFTEFLHRKAKVQEDASIGLVFTSLFALGVFCVTLFTHNAHVGTELVMGSADALKREDVASSWYALALTTSVIFLFFKEFKITTFDPLLARSFGISPALYNFFLLLLTSLVVMSSFRAVGVFMVLALLVIPPLTARLFCHSLFHLLGVAMAIGGGVSLIGVALSRHLLSIYGVGLSTGGVVVCSLTTLYVISILASSWRKKGIKRKVSEVV